VDKEFRTAAVEARKIILKIMVGTDQEVAEKLDHLGRVRVMA
jgi:hypothetical protein